MYDIVKRAHILLTPVMLCNLYYAQDSRASSEISFDHMSMARSVISDYFSNTVALRVRSSLPGGEWFLFKQFVLALRPHMFLNNRYWWLHPNCTAAGEWRCRSTEVVMYLSPHLYCDFTLLDTQSLFRHHCLLLFWFWCNVGLRKLLLHRQPVNREVMLSVCEPGDTELNSVHQGWRQRLSRTSLGRFELVARKKLCSLHTYILCCVKRFLKDRLKKIN